MHSSVVARFNQGSDVYHWPLLTILEDVIRLAKPVQPYLNWLSPSSGPTSFETDNDSDNDNEVAPERRL